MIIGMFHVKRSATCKSAERRSACTVVRDNCDVSRETVPFVAPTPNTTILRPLLDPALNSPTPQNGTAAAKVLPRRSLLHVKHVGSYPAAVDNHVQAAAREFKLFHVKHVGCDQVDFHY